MQPDGSGNSLLERTGQKAESLPEMERILATLARRENRWRVYDQLAERAQLDLDPSEVWLVSRIGEGVTVDKGAPGLAGTEASLRARGLVDDGRLSAAGERAYTRIVDARSVALAELLDGWKPEEHDDVRRLVDRLARELVGEMPAPIA